MNTIADNLKNLRTRIASAAARAGRAPGEITLVGVSKTFPADSIRRAYEAGLRHFGENKVQEWEAKRAGLNELKGQWHFMGHLQSNKVRKAVSVFDRVDSVDSTPLAAKLENAAAEQGKVLPVLIEVHLGDESSKSGVAEHDLDELARAMLVLPHLNLQGLMTIPPFFEKLEGVRPFFARLRKLRDALRASLHCDLPVLSMGMSHDFEIAIEEGASEVRIGTALFGERPTAID